MPFLPAVCLRCGRPAPGGVEVFGGGTITGLTIQGGYGGPCAHCGGPTRSLDGTYDFADGLVSVLSMPEWSTTALLRANEILVTASRVAADKSIGDAEAIARLEKKLDSLSEMVSTALSNSIRTEAAVGAPQSDKERRSLLRRAIDNTYNVIDRIVTTGDAASMSVETIKWIVRTVLGL